MLQVLGSFSATFNIPISVYGSHTVSVSDTVNSVSATFTVNPSIALNPSNGIVGSTVTVSGFGFPASSSISATFGGSTVTVSGTKTTDSTGSFSGTTFTVPTQTVGSKNVAITAGAGTGSASFTVNPSITLNPTSGNVGATVTVAGTGYAGNSRMTIQYDTTTLTTSPGTVTTSTSGTFSCTFIVPSSSGSHTVSATDSSSNTASAPFAVNPVIQPITVTSTIQLQLVQ